jgi:4-amino-4-deoxy-L-arabinose transferase-like glycosyltransferase
VGCAPGERRARADGLDSEESVWGEPGDLRREDRALIANLFGLLLLNGCFLVAGIGVTGAAGWWCSRRALVGSLGLSYLIGVATFGVLAQLLYVLGASLARWQVVLLCAVPACGAIRGIRAAVPVQEPGRTRTRLDLLAVPVVLVLALLAVDLWYQPLWAYDSWTFWTPKAHALYALNGLDSSWFTSAALINKDYPILLPSVEAAGFRFTGYQTALLDIQSWLLFVAFVRTVYEVGTKRANPAVLWTVLLMLALAPSALDQLAAAEADIPAAVFFAAAGLCAWAWLFDGRPGALALAAVLAAGAAATKVEGLMFVIALFAVVAAVAARSSWLRAGAALLAGVVALAVGILPWRIWIIHHDVANQASFGRVTGASSLAHHAARLPIAVGYLGMKLVDPRAWLLLVPLAAFVAVDALRRGRRLDVSFVIAVVCLTFAGLVLAYWSTPFPFHDQLATSARRVITAIALFAAATTPLLSADADGGPV